MLKMRFNKHYNTPQNEKDSNDFNACFCFNK